MQTSNILERYSELASAFMFRQNFDKRECATPKMHPNELDGVELLLVLGLTSKVDVFKSYIQKSGCKLVFIEDDLGAIEDLVGHKELEELFANKRVELIVDPSQNARFISDISQKCYIVDLYQNKNHLCQEIITRQMNHNASIDNHCNHALTMSNFFKNLEKLDGSIHIESLKNKLSKESIILCGAAPSMLTSQSILKKLKNRAVIIAVGTGALALEKIGVVPDFIVATCPNLSEFERFKEIKNRHVPIMYTTRLHHEVLPLFTGPKIFIPFEAAMRVDEYFNEALGVEVQGLFPINESFFEGSSTVTHLGITLCQYLGAEKVFLCGLDFCLTQSQRYIKDTYCEEKLKAEERLENDLLRYQKIEALNCQNDIVETSHHFLKEKEVLESYIEHYHQLEYINLSKSGLEIHGAKGFEPQQLPQKDFNLNKFLDQINKPLKISKKKINGAKNRLKRSLIRTRELAILLQDPEVSRGKKLVYEMDLQDELSYRVLLEESYIAMCFSSNERVYDLELLKLLVEKYLGYLL
jgi:hypothetical protein